MRSVVVTGPDQTQWTVRVAWEPRWRAALRRRDELAAQLERGDPSVTEAALSRGGVSDGHFDRCILGSDL